MNDRKLFFKTNMTGFVLGAVLLGTVTGCIGYVDGPRAGVYVAPPAVEVGFAVQDDYVYYPSYGVYYSSSRRQYAYPEGGRWVSQPAPREVSVAVLHASPSVRMDFHDSPEHHNAEVVQKYPKNWKASGANKNQENDQHGGNN